MTNRSARNPAFMRAAFIRTLGGPDAIEYGHLPVPAPGPEDVLLRMEAVAVNHVDLLIRSGAYATQLEFPFIVGRDVVGTVQAVGSDVRSLAPGDRAWSNSLGHAGRQGSFSEFVLAAAERVYRLPAGVTAEKAVAVLHGGATAYLGLVREACLIAGETVVILGAGGAVGSAAVQIAVSLGARVLAVAAGADLGWVTGLGAQSVLDYREPQLHRRLEELTDGGAEVAWDCSGSMKVNHLATLLGVGGRIIHTAGIHARQDIDTGALYVRDISLHGFAISNASVADLDAAATLLNALFAGRGIEARLGMILPLSAAARSHQLLEQGTRHGIGGKIVLIPTH
ncbi:NADPH:quinone reductase [Paeniglutamicibacter cryotolerans]|uniref:NADPH:quinone reductase-like Zn-dependent oxidoreductase n=1 Tax=Paeniglutamicibacter cryotolerans TaxID=670079 RepID=A0A839QVL4_9MICC|nr:NADPH:quinone reductase [Paeniglutamicibacter cryotolerans]MBB2997342.1 NADPH:quinone reductase-like Zn-dependent oxidoreductase [Paeniglutamicibacter cryotolerans]